MNDDLILELVELAISFAETQLEGQDLDETLFNIAHKGIRAYEDHTGELLDPSEIDVEFPI